MHQGQVRVGSAWHSRGIQSRPAHLSPQHLHLPPDDAAMIPKRSLWS